MEKVIIYGISNIELRRSAEHFLDGDRFEIIGYSDTYYPFDWIDGGEFIQPGKIMQTEYDYIIVANTSSFDIIKKSLVDMGVPEDKIVPTSILLWGSPVKSNEDVCKRVDYYNRLKEQRDAIVCGLSYSWRGIIYDELGLSTYNLSASGLDMYYNLRLIEKCNPNVINGCKYCFLVFPYYYFNYDMSRSLGQYTSGQIMQIMGLKDWHNANKTKGSIEYINMFRLFGRKIMSYYNIAKPEYINRSYKKIGAGGTLDRIWHGRYENTYEENEKIFNQLIETLNNKQIILVIPPVLYDYLGIESRRAFADKKEQFYSALNSYKDCITIWDYATEYGSEKLFDSLDHLNYQGAKVFTRDLKKRVDILRKQNVR